MLIYCEARKQVPSGTPPDWVTDWLEGREKRAKKASDKAGTADKPRDEEAAAKRAEQRESRVDAGVTELMLWMADLASGGLAAAREQPGSFWDNVAAWMVDAQAPGLARMVGSIQSALLAGRAGRSAR